MKIVQSKMNSLCEAISKNNSRMSRGSRHKLETSRGHLKIWIIQTKINKIWASHHYSVQIKNQQISSNTYQIRASKIDNLINNSKKAGLLKIYQTKTQGKVYQDKYQTQSDNDKTLTHSRLINKYINASWAVVVPSKKLMN